MSRNGTSQAQGSRPGPGPDVIVFGQIARDLVLVVDAVPTASRSADVYQRRDCSAARAPIRQWAWPSWVCGPRWPAWSARIRSASAC
ncbi:MAG TPA: hypothetical protein VGF32_28610 [Streptosporangiaceae bacterium]